MVVWITSGRIDFDDPATNTVGHVFFETAAGLHFDDIAAMVTEWALVNDHPRNELSWLWDQGTIVL